MTDPVPAPQDVAATFCATVVDELVRGGVRHAFVCPGSRSTPMALALAEERRLDVHVHHDERAGSFAALGAALASGRPSVVLTTSGTAAAELHAAIVEAHQARVPVIVLTADRPPELRDVGAPQTIDQQHLFGRAVRWFVDVGVPDHAARGAWRSIAARAVDEATGAPPGPVHVNLPFREPLVGTPGTLPAGRPGGAPFHLVRRSGGERAALVLDRSRRGLIVAGRGAAAHARAIRGSRWPVIADPRSALDGVVHADSLLRIDGVRDEMRPDVVVRIGDPPASRVVNEWIDGSGAEQHVVGDALTDPARAATTFADAVSFTDDQPQASHARRWQRLDRAAAEAIGGVLDRSRSITEPGVARAVVAAMPSRAQLVLASSMPVRDVEWYAPRRTDIGVHANRGANGIDGVVSTALGVALTGASTYALVGDLAFLHDSTALVALAARDVQLTIVVVDNDGGGIFSFLPQASALGAERFEQLFGTPHGTDCVALAQAHGLPAVEVTTPGALARSLRPAPGPRVVVARSDRAANVEVHRRLNAAVATAAATAISAPILRTGE
jgi:2-succinyl-5-enolpyruvyl-6-hydroxy-3-cyclohexene-1-carboxylate synthase